MKKTYFAPQCTAIQLHVDHLLGNGMSDNTEKAKASDSGADLNARSSRDWADDEE